MQRNFFDSFFKFLKSGRCGVRPSAPSRRRLLLDLANSKRNEIDIAG
jgi:hypothetical protein